jgi:hypothetical protein
MIHYSYFARLNITQYACNLFNWLTHKKFPNQ